MAPKFLYVFTEEARDKMVMVGFQLLKGDEARHIYVFANSDTLNSINLDFSILPTDTLTF